MRVIELIGGPGSGKTTNAARLWGHLKAEGVFAEYLREPAQVEIFKRGDLTKVTQLHLSAQLLQDLTERKRVGVEVTIIDTPILGPFIYQEEMTHNQFLLFKSVQEEIYSSFQFDTVLIQRSEHSNWRKEGRMQDLQASLSIDTQTQDVYSDMGRPFHIFLNGPDTAPDKLASALKLL